MTKDGLDTPKGGVGLSLEQESAIVMSGNLLQSVRCPCLGVATTHVIWLTLSYDLFQGVS